jgi:Immunoglobulin I-set domain.
VSVREYSDSHHQTKGFIISLIFRFNNIATGDEGKYTCIAENSAGKEVMNAYIHVLTLPAVTITPSEYVSVRPGEPLTLECEATGRPMPTVSWVKYIAPL